MSFPENQLPPQPSPWMNQFLQLSQPASVPAVPFSPIANSDIRNYLEQIGTPNQDVTFKFQNPYAYSSWGTGLDPGAGFGTKLGSYVGNNMPLLLGGLNAISGAMGAWTGLQAVRNAKDALKQQKKEFNINLSNQTQSYNTAISDRIAGRHYNSEAERQAALAAATLVDRSKYGQGG